MFQIIRGESRTFSVEVRDAAGVLVPLAGSAIRWSARDNAGTVLLAKANTAAGGGDAQIEITGTGVFAIKFTASDSSSAPITGVCSALVVLADGTSFVPVGAQIFEIWDSPARVL